MSALIIVTASFDSDAQLWSARSDDLGGLFLQATSWKALVDTVPDEVGKLLPRGLFSPSRDVAIEVIAHKSTSWRQPASSGAMCQPA